MAKKELTQPEIWARFGDVGRVALIGGAALLPLRKGKWDGCCDGVTSVLVAACACKTIKPFVPERRPNGEDRDSFPSQHAAECFAAGLALRRCSKRFGAAAIGVGSMVAMSRLFARKHFLIDVVAGIAIGAASTIAVEAYEGSRG